MATRKMEWCIRAMPSGGNPEFTQRRDEHHDAPTSWSAPHRFRSLSASLRRSLQGFTLANRALYVFGTVV